MCGGPCGDCKGHAYAHGPAAYAKICVDCYMKRFPTQPYPYVRRPDGKWDNATYPAD